MDLDEAEYEIAVVGASQAAKITRIIDTTAGEIFGDKTMTFEDETLEEAKARKVLWIAFEGDGLVGNATMNAPKDKVRPKSALGRFHARYGSLPRVGMVVSAHLDENLYGQLDV
jgi:uncharacterized cupredoxin-like copper-binding protein